MKKLLFVLTCLCVVSLSHATIIKGEAENATLIDSPGNNWSTIYDAAAGSEIITSADGSFVSPPAEAATRFFKFKAPAGTYSLYIRYTKADDGSEPFLNDSFFCSDSSFAYDAVMATRNNTPATGLDDISCEAGSYAWVNIDNNYVQAVSGTAYFKVAPREDGWRFDAFAFVTADETVSDEILNNAAEYEPYAAYDPSVTPENDDGSVGTPVDVGGDWQVNDVSLHFSAGPDPAEVEPLNPDIVKHNVFLQTGAPDDPNLYLIGTLDQTSPTDPAQSIGPMSSLTPPVSLDPGVTYLWQVEEVMDNGAGGYPSGDPNNIFGPVWSFVTSGLTPEITSISDHMLTDSAGNTSFTIGTTIVANNYRWYKVVGEVDSEENAEVDDVEIDGLTDSGIYSGYDTKTLVITGAAADGSNDAQVYAIAYNGIPDEMGTTVSDPSQPRWFWYPRLVNYYTFETMNVVDGNDVTPDLVSGYDMTMLSNDIGDDVPSQNSNIPSAGGIAGNQYSLKFNNPRANDPNASDTQYAQVDEGWACGYKDITISAWVYSSGSSNWNRILDYGNDTDHYVMLCVNVNGDDNDAVRFAVKDGADNEQTVTTSNDALPDDVWTLVTATLKDNTARIYMNGELAATSTTLTNNPVNYGPTVNNWIGRSQWGASDGYFNGMIDELKIWNYGLTTVEVGQDYIADTLDAYICNSENYDLGVYDTNDDCVISMLDFADLAVRWLEDDRIHHAP